jgi:transposase
MTETPDEVIEHIPGYCQLCGEGLVHLPGLLSERRQVVDIPPIEPIYTEHRV